MDCDATGVPPTLLVAIWTLESENGTGQKPQFYLVQRNSQSNMRGVFCLLPTLAL
jgi:hypothetical protein